MRTTTPARASVLKALAQSLWRVMTTSTLTPRRAAACRALHHGLVAHLFVFDQQPRRAEAIRATSASWAPGLQTRSAGEHGGRPPFAQSSAKVDSTAATSA